MWCIATEPLGGVAALVGRHGSVPWPEDPPVLPCCSLCFDPLSVPSKNQRCGTTTRKWSVSPALATASLPNSVAASQLRVVELQSSAECETWRTKLAPSLPWTIRRLGKCRRARAHRKSPTATATACETRNLTPLFHAVLCYLKMVAKSLITLTADRGNLSCRKTH